MKIEEKIDKYLGERKANSLSGMILKKVNNRLKIFTNNKEFNKVPLDDINKILKNFEIFLVSPPDKKFNKSQETMYIGLVRKTPERGGSYVTGRLNNKLYLSYKKTKSGKYEIESYIV
jgi:hypothetical protein